ncbi:MAG: ABC transporter permease [Burkholderiales bacterium]
MRALDRKLLRDLARMWSQAATIALVVASGVGGWLTSLSAVDSLAAARDRYYVEGRFADVFAELVRAPRDVADALLAVPGVADVQPTVERLVRVEVDGVVDPIIGRLVGVDTRRARRLNRVDVRAGQPLEAGAALRGDGTIDALVSAAFADAHRLRPGSTVHALVNGRRRALAIRGIALSPEHVFAQLGGAPDVRGYGVFWVDERALAAAYDMDGAFDHVSIRLAPGADEAAVVAEPTRRLAPWGARDAHGRADQPSNRMLADEIREQRVLGTVLPVIFLAVAAFLLNVVVSRLVATQREQIAALKALGYPNATIAAHYLKLVGLIVLAGLALGVAVGDVLGAMLTRLYAEFFRFPSFEHRLAPGLVATGAAVALGTALVGTLNAIWATVRLPPAEAMHAPAPGHYRPTLVERLGVHGLGTAQRMILRNMERRPWRTALSVGGVATAVAIVIVGGFVRDAMDAIVQSAFGRALRADVVVWMADPVDDATRHAIARLPGVIAVESGRDVAVRFVGAHRVERGQVRGRVAVPDLNRIVDVDGRVVVPPDDGLLMTDRLAAKLGLAVGDTVRIEVLEGARRTLEVPIAGTVRETMGLNAYIERRALNRLLGEGDVATQYALAVERGAEPRLLEAARGLPRLAGTFSKATLERNMREVSARNVRIMSTIMTVFAAVIAVGVVYNNARIALAERTWELASLRVLGFTRAEVSALLLGEQALVIAAALPLGLVLGRVLVHGIVGLLASDRFEFPVEILPRTDAWAASCVVVAGIASALVVRRRVDRLDLVAALKTRE